MNLYEMETKARALLGERARIVFGIALISVGLAGRASYRESTPDLGLALAYAVLFGGVALLWGPITRAVIVFVRDVRTNEEAQGSAALHRFTSEIRSWPKDQAMAGLRAVIDGKIGIPIDIGRLQTTLTLAQFSRVARALKEIEIEQGTDAPKT